MKSRPLATIIFLGALALPVSTPFLSVAFGADSTTAQTGSKTPAQSDRGDDRPRIEEHHEGMQGIELFILGGAFVAALGIAYRVGKLSTSRTKKDSQ